MDSPTDFGEEVPFYSIEDWGAVIETHLNQ